MTCNEVREILFAFLDSELDAALSIELQRHLERCAECAREAEIERSIRRHLVSTLTDETGVAAFEPPPRKALLRTRARSVALRRRVGVLLFGIVGLALTVTASAWFAQRTAKTSDDFDPLASLLVMDFEHFLAEGRKLQLASDDRQAVADWLRAQTGLAVALPDMSGGHCKLIGGRKCKLAGQPVAFALYEVHGQPASLVLLGGDNPAAEKIRGTRAPAGHWRDQRDGYTVVAVAHEERVLAAVSRLSEDQLLPLLNKVAGK